MGVGHKNLVVDISLCEHIDSTFIGAIIQSFKRVTSVGGALRIVKPVNSAVDIFILTNTLGVFDIYKTRLIAKNVWEPAESIGILNTEFNDFCPSTYFDSDKTLNTSWWQRLKCWWNGEGQK